MENYFVVLKTRMCVTYICKLTLVCILGTSFAFNALVHIKFNSNQLIKRLALDTLIHASTET